MSWTTDSVIKELAKARQEYAVANQAERQFCENASQAQLRRGQTMAVERKIRKLNSLLSQRTSAE